MRGKDRNGRADVACVAAVALLLVIAAVGVRARAGLPETPPGWAAASLRAFNAAAGLIVALAATACLVLLVFVFRGGSGLMIAAAAGLAGPWPTPPDQCMA